MFCFRPLTGIYIFKRTSFDALNKAVAFPSPYGDLHIQTPVPQSPYKYWAQRAFCGGKLQGGIFITEKYLPGSETPDKSSIVGNQVRNFSWHIPI